MAKDKLSEKESALIAAALAEAAKRKMQGDASRPGHSDALRSAASPAAAAAPSALTDTTATAGPSALPALKEVPATEPAPTRTPDPAALAERIARMMEAERTETLRRKRRMKAAGTALIVAVALPVMAWALTTLLAQLAR